ncbi:MAG: hypothetical protein F4X20_03760 [Dehalococcoidia bacterium]|nr:hypothetical protein [Dehalococcoidia bacterium]
MRSQEIHEWVEEQLTHAASWWVKRLSGRDTLAMGARNPGPRIPRELLFEFLPELGNPHESKPKVKFLLNVDSSGDRVLVTASSITVRLARGESRKAGLVTDWGGVSNPLLDPENTGAAAVFAFHARSGDTLPECHVWICANLAEEEDVVEPIWGPILPGVEVLISKANGVQEKRY